MKTTTKTKLTMAAAGHFDNLTIKATQPVAFFVTYVRGSKENVRGYGRGHVRGYIL